jgi:hypothetical protein
MLEPSTTIALDLPAGLRKRDCFLLRAQVQFLRTVLRLGDGDGSLRVIRL